LIHEKSPYLQQHAFNPVDWQPWSEATLARAKKEDKPIFLSIGYSTCHWCHVMERESFENEEVAKVLNAHFIPVKLDREERPDIDQVYMTAVQGLTGSGGWPLSVWLTPDLKPFYGGTYFPPENRMGRPGFRPLLLELARVWKERRGEVDESAAKIAGFIAANARSRASGEGGVPGIEVFDQAYDHYVRQFDAAWGGFGPAPKFPRSEAVQLLLRVHARTGKPHALAMCETTLDRMARGGMYDHLGGGFARYSTDERWLIPHFEKMLYDNALLARAYLEAYQATGKEPYARIAREIFAYVLRDMTDPGGAFYSAEDADSEGEEGKFYVWTPAEIEAVLGKEEGALFCRVYGVTAEGNFEHGTSALWLERPVAACAAAEKLELAALEARLAAARKALFDVRAKRVRPHRDDKVLTAWNALMISALAHGAQVLEEPRYAEAAARAARFLLANLRKDGRLLARWRQGEARFPAYLDDHAFLAAALIDLYETDFDPAWFREARRLQAETDRLFGDASGGGYYFTGSDQETVVARMKDAYDGALPSGNSVAAQNALRLWSFTGDEAYRTSAESVFGAFGDFIGQAPFAVPRMLCALDYALGKPREVAIAGAPGAEDTQAMLRAVRRPFLPNRVVAFAPDGTVDAETEALIPLLARRSIKDGRATAYVCEGTVCKAPVTSAEELAELLK
jgi:uncharacterized protein YyaL (SSP411 family)